MGVKRRPFGFVPDIFTTETQRKLRSQRRFFLIFLCALLIPLCLSCMKKLIKSFNRFLSLTRKRGSQSSSLMVTVMLGKSPSTAPLAGLLSTMVN